MKELVFSTYTHHLTLRRNLGKGFFVSVISILTSSCVEPFAFKAIDFDKVIVVEGSLTDESKMHSISLSYTRPISEEDPNPISGAEVWVEDDEGFRIDFDEKEPGLYQTTPDASGIVGKSYQLFFIIDGDSYYSTPQKLIPSPPIDSIYDAYFERISKETDQVVKGIQFFLDTHDDSNQAQYFKYEWEETFEVRAPNPSFYEFRSDPDTAIVRDKDVYICYQTNNSSEIIIETTANQSKNRLAQADLRFITSEIDQLRYEYSILAKQYTISLSAYSYYREYLANNEETGSLFDKQLGSVVGNIRSIENPDEGVLGFFEVSGVSSKRFFVKYEELDSRFPWPSYQYECTSDQLVQVVDNREPPYDDITDSLRYYARGKGYNITIASYCKKMPETPYCEGIPYFRAELAPAFCTDCRFRGPNEKPDYWIY